MKDQTLKEKEQHYKNILLKNSSFTLRDILCAYVRQFSFHTVIIGFLAMLEQLMTFPDINKNEIDTKKLQIISIGVKELERMCSTLEKMQEAELDQLLEIEKEEKTYNFASLMNKINQNHVPQINEGITEIRSALSDAITCNASHLITVIDTFEGDCYYIKVRKDENVKQKVAEIIQSPMQLVKEVYNLSMNLEEQLKSTERVYNL